jgi:hypothetical protein
MMAMEPDDTEDSDPPADPPEEANETAGLSFETDVWPIFNEKCGSCHVTSGLGGQNIGSEDLAEALADSKDFETAVLRDLTSGRMPSGCSGEPGSGPPCVTEEDFATIESWYDEGSPP